MSTLDYSSFQGIRSQSVTHTQGVNDKQIVLPSDPGRMFLYIEGGTGNNGVVTAGAPYTFTSPTSANQQLPYMLLFGGNPGLGRGYRYEDFGPIIQDQIWVTTPNFTANVNLSSWSIDCPFSRRLCPDNRFANLTWRGVGCFRSGNSGAVEMAQSNPSRAGMVIRAIGGDQYVHFGSSQVLDRVFVSSIIFPISITISELGNRIADSVFMDLTVQNSFACEGAEIFRI